VLQCIENLPVLEFNAFTVQTHNEGKPLPRKHEAEKYKRPYCGTHHNELS
jgi:hypothetical protein